MKKKLFLTLLCLFLLCSFAFAAVAVKDDGVYEGEATTIDFTSTGVSVTFDGTTANVAIPSTLIALGLYNGDVTVVVTGTTTLAAAYKVAYVYVTTKTLTLGNGTTGQVMQILGEPGTDTGTLTITATTKSRWGNIQMDDDEDTVTLLYVDDTYGWTYVGGNGVSVTQASP